MVRTGMAAGPPPAPSSLIPPGLPGRLARPQRPANSGAFVPASAREPCGNASPQGHRHRAGGQGLPARTPPAAHPPAPQRRGAAACPDPRPWVGGRWGGVRHRARCPRQEGAAGAGCAVTAQRVAAAGADSALPGMLQSLGRGRGGWGDAPAKGCEHVPELSLCHQRGDVVLPGGGLGWFWWLRGRGGGCVGRLRGLRTGRPLLAAAVWVLCSRHRTHCPVLSPQVCAVPSAVPGMGRAGGTPGWEPARGGVPSSVPPPWRRRGSSAAGSMGICMQGAGCLPRCRVPASPCPAGGAWGLPGGDPALGSGAAAEVTRCWQWRDGCCRRPCPGGGSWVERGARCPGSGPRHSWARRRGLRWGSVAGGDPRGCT